MHRPSSESVQEKFVRSHWRIFDIKCGKEKKQESKSYDTSVHDVMYFMNDFQITSRLSSISSFNTYFLLSDRPHIITCFSKFFKYVRYFEKKSVVPHVSGRTADTHQNETRRLRILQDDMTSDIEASGAILNWMIFRFSYFFISFLWTSSIFHRFWTSYHVTSVTTSANMFWRIVIGVWCTVIF